MCFLGSGQGTCYDECGRRCRCVNGQLVNCCRVRKEFTSMSHTERERYIKAVKTISTVLPYKTIYTQLIQKHRTLFFTAIHQRDEFLPWHRWFILEYENLLRMVDCRITVPYWDWSIWAHNPWGPHVWHPSTRGMGGNGFAGSGQCVQTGPFRQGVWQLTNNQCLRRNFNGIPPDAAAIQYCLSLTVFVDFENYLHIPLHDNVHCLIGKLGIRMF